VAKLPQGRDEFFDMHTLPVARLDAMTVKDPHGLSLAVVRLQLSPRVVAALVKAPFPTIFNRPPVARPARVPAAAVACPAIPS
jgi:hypothetical protein